MSYNSPEEVYTQDFDTLPNTANGTTFTWTDNSTLPGWYAANSTTTSFNPAGVTAGATTTGNLYSFGSSLASDRALGSIGSGSVGNMFWGVQLVNNTGNAITGFTIRYTGEQWRNSAAAAQTMTVEYSFSATSVKTGLYTVIAGASFTSPVTSGTSGALNGNTTGNRTVIGPITVTGVYWLPGASLWIRFSDPDHSGFDHGLATDEFSFTANGVSQTYDPPSTYYNAAQGLTGDDLAAALHDIISNQTVIPYVDTLAALKVLDEDPNDATKVRLVYSATSVPKSETNWDRAPPLASFERTRRRRAGLQRPVQSSPHFSRRKLRAWQ